MTADEAEGRLRELLAAAGVDLESPSRADVAKTWDVWRRFAAEPIAGIDPDPEGDILRAEYLVVDWFEGDGEHFEVSLTRQFYAAFPDDEGEFHDQQQRSCTFRYTVTDALRALEERCVESFDVDLDTFFERMLALPGFQLADGPVALRIG